MLGNHLLVSSGRFIPIAALEVLYTKKEMIKKKTEKKKDLVTALKKLFAKQEIIMDLCICGVNA